MGFEYVRGATPALEYRKLTSKAFLFSGGRPNRFSPLEFGAVYPLLLFFNFNFLKGFSP
jgi:hypothetical protein